MNSLTLDHGYNSHAPDAVRHQAQQGALIGVNIGCGKMPEKKADAILQSHPLLFLDQGR
ncbi:MULTISPECIES: hypothetical protein [Brucella]|jgi:hypothetical protein|uniref:hypothetical protein n=1 Tax=Brucella TaxID=234 RepID=UPI00178C409A|nr:MULTISPECIES: hypothetical protein [Brucella]QTN04553.1 hypothetical protein GTN27_15105 [Ochrobactrum sp. EEELCW01]UVV69984.1 hypothetical protein NW321_15565 [Brucella anthropi]UZD68174.1 hypothetical protein LJ361_13455 [Brucella sp. JSBI001]